MWNWFCPELKTRHSKSWRRRLKDVSFSPVAESQRHGSDGGQRWRQLVTALWTPLSSGCGRSPGWASEAGKHPGCKTHCSMPGRERGFITCQHKAYIILVSFNVHICACKAAWHKYRQQIQTVQLQHIFFTCFFFSIFNPFLSSRRNICNNGVK